MAANRKTKRKDRGDGRDTAGRWIDSGNPKGRPKKLPRLDMGDPYYFSKEMQQITINGETRWMDRRELVLMKTYESALKGRISAQRFLLQLFQQEIDARHQLELTVQTWMGRIKHDPESVPDSLYSFHRQAQETLVAERKAIDQHFRNPRKRKRKNPTSD